MEIKLHELPGRVPLQHYHRTDWHIRATNFLSQPTTPEQIVQVCEAVIRTVALGKLNQLLKSKVPALSEEDTNL